MDDLESASRFDEREEETFLYFVCHRCILHKSIDIEMVYLVYLQQVCVFELSSLILDVGSLAYDTISRFDHLVDGLKLCKLQLMNGPLSSMGIGHIFPIFRHIVLIISPTGNL